MPILNVPVDAVPLPARATGSTRLRPCLGAALIAAGTLASGMADAEHRAKTHAEAVAQIDHAVRDTEQAAEEQELRMAPDTTLGPPAQQRARAAAAELEGRGSDQEGSWTLLGPTVGNVPANVSVSGRPSTVSGRVTAIAVSPRCRVDDCSVLVGTAGGGIWRTEDGLDRDPEWRSSSRGLPTNAIGSLVFDPTDPSARTVYAGTGEGFFTPGSEAGFGLYLSTDGGRTWTVVPGSVGPGLGRSITAVAVDPVNAAHLWIGTVPARHGADAEGAGGQTPPGVAPTGLYESLDGGQTFTLAFSVASSFATCCGVTHIETYRLAADPRVPTQVYFSMASRGIYRATAGGYELAYASRYSNPRGNSRTEFALVPMGQKLRIYAADTAGFLAEGVVLRVDDANIPASQLASPGSDFLGAWIFLSRPSSGDPGFTSYGFCGISNCARAMVIASPPGQPDTVWVGGAFPEYNDPLLTALWYAKTAIRSIDAGVHFSDITNDAEAPERLMPSGQHVIAFVPGNPNVAFLGSDGGVMRNDGVFVDGTDLCVAQNFTGTDLIDCNTLRSAIPRELLSLNAGLAAMQFWGIALNPNDPLNDIIGGTANSGTWAYDGRSRTWFESISSPFFGTGSSTGFGTGGNVGIAPGPRGARMHTYSLPGADVNFQGSVSAGWDWVGDPLYASNEFNVLNPPLLADQGAPGTFFIGLQHVWRTQDNGGPQAVLDQHCGEYANFDGTVTCGDWQPLGGPFLGDSAFGVDKLNGVVAVVARSAAAGSPLWSATRLGRVFVSMAPDAVPAATVDFTRIDTPAQPPRTVSAILVDPANPLHAWIAFSGYGFNTPATPGHVFDVVYDPTQRTAVWADLTGSLGDQPVLALAIDPASGGLYAATDFGVVVHRPRTGDWQRAADGLPPAVVDGLSFDVRSRTLVAATHGRGVWTLKLRGD